MRLTPPYPEYVKLIAKESVGKHFKDAFADIKKAGLEYRVLRQDGLFLDPILPNEGVYIYVEIVDGMVTRARPFIVTTVPSGSQNRSPDGNRSPDEERPRRGMFPDPFNPSSLADPTNPINIASW